MCAALMWALLEKDFALEGLLVSRFCAARLLVVAGRHGPGYAELENRVCCLHPRAVTAGCREVDFAFHSPLKYLLVIA